MAIIVKGDSKKPKNRLAQIIESARESLSGGYADPNYKLNPTSSKDQGLENLAKKIKKGTKKSQSEYEGHKEPHTSPDEYHEQTTGY